ncbi:lipid A export ATP-binding/permease protein MsbA [Lachnospiraceae bacterium KM106-2]|nr:lipid A export ATP-binding/permease protein MsbA [Lachnospiraceae bacterium KM106-2]
MSNLFKYLKRSMGTVVVIFVLLILQASGDLSLPSYTSDIVNIGIQQNGIEHISPEVMRESQLSKLEYFLDDTDIQFIKDSYEYKKKGTSNLEDKYPAIAKEGLYIRKDNADIEALDEKLARPMLLVSMLSGTDKKSVSMREKMIAGVQASMPKGTDLSKADIFDVFKMIGKDNVKVMLKDMIKQVDDMDDYMVNQMAIQTVQGEYKAVGINIEALQRNYIIVTGLKMIGIAFAIMVASVLVTMLASRVGAKIGRDLRGSVFKKVVSFSSSEMDQFSTASLITRSTNDIQQVQMLVVMLLRMVLYAPILGIGGIFKVLQTNVSMTWIIALAVGVILAIVLVLLVIAMPKFNRMQKLVDRINLVTREILTGLPVIRAFSTERHEEKRFDKANQDLTRNTLFTNRVMTFMMPMMMFVMNGISVLIVWVSAKNIDAGTMQVGDMMAFIQYTMQIVMSFLMLTMISIMFPRAAVSAKRIDEVLKTPNQIQDPEHSEITESTSTTGVLKFNHVSFRYPNADENVLHDIDFTALPGQTTAFIGSTGSGKSTLVNLIPRFYDVTEGNITLDDIDIRKMSQHELRDRLGFVPQKAMLFSGDIRSNIAYGCENADMSVIEKAASIAQATDFIEAKPEKYDSAIAQGGSNVSGGQKQRLSIARAIAKKPEVYVFDDSFSALDYKTDVAVRKALKSETGHSTVLIVAQRISTIMHADQIIVLDEGKIAGIGTHQQLLRDNEVYQQIAYSQLSKEEIEKDLKEHYSKEVQ